MSEKAKEIEQTIAALAASMLQPLELVTAAAHELRNRITPDAIPSSHRIAEARTALALASNTLSVATAQFLRVAELLKGI
jgi:hypothetical protein